RSAHGDELVEGHPLPDPRGPAVELRTEALQVEGDVGGDAEVDERELLGPAARDLCDRRVPRREVDVGRRRDRPDLRPRDDAYAARVAGEERPVTEVADVVRRVAGRRERLPAEQVALGEAHVLAGHRRELAPELVERRAVEPARRAFEAARVDEVRGADLG